MGRLDCQNYRVEDWVLNYCRKIFPLDDDYYEFTICVYNPYSPLGLDLQIQIYEYGKLFVDHAVGWDEESQWNKIYQLLSGEYFH